MLGTFSHRRSNNVFAGWRSSNVLCHVTSVVGSRDVTRLLKYTKLGVVSHSRILFVDHLSVYSVCGFASSVAAEKSFGTSRSESNRL